MARRKKQADASAFSEGAKVEGLEEVSKLANSAASGKTKGIGHNSGGITDDDLKRMIDESAAAKSDVDAAQKILDKAKGVYRASLKVVKDRAGAAMKDAVVNYLVEKKQRENSGDGVVITDQRNKARILRVMSDPLYTQWKLFDDEPDTAGTKAERKSPPGMDAELQGQHAFHNSEPISNNPFTPGTDNFVQWEAGWKNAERAAVAKMGPKNGAAAEASA